MFGPSDELMMFNLTSGTTGKSKLIPITRKSLNEFRHGWQLWGIKAFLDHPSLVLTNILNIVGDCDLRRTASGTPIGMASGLFAKCQNPFIRRYYVLPPAVAKISDSIAKTYTILRLAIERQVGLFTTAIPGAMVRLAKMGDEYRDYLIRDIADGTLNSNFEIDTNIRASIAKRIGKRNPVRARELESIVERTGTLYPKDYWNLSLIGCWLGGTVGVQSSLLSEFYGNVPRRDIGIVASEGRFTIPLEDDATSGVLDICGSYFEFIPTEEIDSETPTVLEAHELQPDRNYYLLLTTSSGFYRYNMLDVVRCTGFIGTTPTLEFLNKGQHISDLEGEKVSEHQFVRAIAHAASSTGTKVDYFTVVPTRTLQHQPRYVVMVEEQVFHTREAEERFLREFEEHLSSINFAYKVRRDDGYLSPPQLVTIKRGSWVRYNRQEIQQRGVGDDHYKHPYLVLDPSFIDRFVRVDRSEPTSAQQSTRSRTSPSSLPPISEKVA
jgi:hypothetical protein